jgi:hypothetical protein
MDRSGRAPAAKSRGCMLQRPADRGLPPGSSPRPGPLLGRRSQPYLIVLLTMPDTELAPPALLYAVTPK